MTDEKAPDLQQLETLFKPLGRPPVEQWNPPLSGDLDMRIATDGQWYYQGSPIRRQRLVNLFSRILKREDDDYFLVTPVEKYRIQVEDVPFIAVDLRSQLEEGVEFLWVDTQVGDTVRLDKQHPLLLRVPPGEDQAVPYVDMRDGLLARFHRNLFYRVIEAALQEPEGELVSCYLVSGGHRFLAGQFPADLLN